MILWAVFSASLFAATTAEGAAADSVTLRDGTVILGQVLEPSSRGKLTVAIRREWAFSHLRSRAAQWDRSEAAWSQRARAQRRERLVTWRRERGAAAGAGDVVTAWLDSEIKRLEGNPAEKPRLMVVELDRTQIRKLDRAGPDSARMLRQAWRGEIAEPEGKPLGELKSMLEGLGFAMSDVDPAPIDDLLPLPFETDARWLARRAATEIAREPDLRYVRYLDTLLPEGANAGGAEMVGAAASALKALLGENPGDPLTPKLADAARRGRVGVVVTKLEMAEDFSKVTVESTLWVRNAATNSWIPAISRPATVRPDDLPADEGKPLEADPQVQAVFRVVEGLGLGGVPQELKQRSLNMGAATRRALGMAQAALNRDLDTLALPVGEASEPPAEPRAANRP